MAAAGISTEDFQKFMQVTRRRIQSLLCVLCSVYVVCARFSSFDLDIVSLIIRWI